MNTVYYARQKMPNGTVIYESVEIGRITHWNIKEFDGLKIYEPCMGERKFISKTNEGGEAAYNEWLHVISKKYQ